MPTCLNEWAHCGPCELKCTVHTIKNSHHRNSHHIILKNNKNENSKNTAEFSGVDNEPSGVDNDVEFTKGLEDFLGKPLSTTTTLANEGTLDESYYQSTKGFMLTMENEEPEECTLEPDKVEKELAATHHPNGSSMDSGPPSLQGQSQSQCGSTHFPAIKIDGNEWREDASKDVPLATTQEMCEVFAMHPGLKEQHNFWVAERASGEGKCGGGLMHLAARAFQQVGDAQLDMNKSPTYEEARWQMDMLIQCNSTNKKQRQRDFQLMSSLTTRMLPNSFFEQTFVPSFNLANKFYGNTGKHSMPLNMPCPKARMVGEVSYVGPKAIIAHAFVNGIPMDNVVVLHPHRRKGHCGTSSKLGDVIHDVDECRKLVDLVKNIEEQCYGIFSWWFT